MPPTRVNACQPMPTHLCTHSDRGETSASKTARRYAVLDTRTRAEPGLAFSCFQLRSVAEYHRRRQVGG